MMYLHIYFHVPNLLSSMIFGLAKQISSWAIEMGVKIMFMPGQVYTKNFHLFR